MKAIKNTATGATFVVREDHAVMIAELKAAGIKFGKTSLIELLEGKRPQVNGFEVVELEEAAGGQNGAAAENVGTTTAGANTGAADDSDKPTVAGGDAADKTLTPEPGTGAAATKPAPQPRQRKVIKAAEPKGKIKPVRKGTKIASGLEMLMAGTTEKALEDAEMSDDIVDFVNRRVTKRGYGIEVNGDQIKLKFPAGVTDVQYTAAGAADDEEAAPANTPAPDSPAAPAADNKADDTAAPAADQA